MCVYKRFEILKPGLGRQSQRIPQLFRKRGWKIDRGMRYERNRDRGDRKQDSGREREKERCQHFEQK